MPVPADSAAADLTGPRAACHPGSTTSVRAGRCSRPRRPHRSRASRRRIERRHGLGSPGRRRPGRGPASPRSSHSATSCVTTWSKFDVIGRDPGTTDLRRRVQGGLRRAGPDRLQADRVRRLHAARQRRGWTYGVPQLLKQWLDDNGLEGEGNHGSIPGSITDASLASFDAACEAANVLGMGRIGTGSDPTSSSYLADWQLVAERWNVLGERAMNKHGLKLYTHNHSPAYSFLLDSGPLDSSGRPTRSSGTRRREWFLDNTDSRYVFWRWTIAGRTIAQYHDVVLSTYTAPGDLRTSVDGRLRPAVGQRPPEAAEAGALVVVPSVPRPPRRCLSSPSPARSSSTLTTYVGATVLRRLNSRTT